MYRIYWSTSEPCKLLLMNMSCNSLVRYLHMFACIIDEVICCRCYITEEIICPRSYITDGDIGHSSYITEEDICLRSYIREDIFSRK